MAEHIRGMLELKPGRAGRAQTRIARCGSTRAWSGPGWASPPTRAGPGEVAGQAIQAAAQAKDNPADLINVALEELVRARLELPGYSTLDERGREHPRRRSTPRCSPASPPG